VAALGRFTKKLKGPVVLDGEIVALDEHGEPAGFQKLQGRIHLTESHSRSRPGAWPLSPSTCSKTARKIFALFP
jgi:ATP-dependent DNA ligase